MTYSSICESILPLIVPVLRYEGYKEEKLQLFCLASSLNVLNVFVLQEVLRYIIVVRIKRLFQGNGARFRLLGVG